MKQFLPVVLAFFLCTSLVSCQRNDGVRAGSEDEYQPLPAPATKGEQTTPGAHDMVRGELLRIDVRDKTFVVRVENGMEQTIRFDDDTTFTGVNTNGKNRSSEKNSKNAPKALARKVGSEVIIHVMDRNGVMTATSVDVMNPAAKSK